MLIPLAVQFRTIFSEAINLLKLDGGVVIGIQVFSFLLGHFFIPNPSGDPNKFLQLLLLIAFIYIANFSAMLNRMYCLKKGIVTSIQDCYIQALKRCPMFILLNIIGMGCLCLLLLPFTKLCAKYYSILPEADWLLMVNIGTGILLFLVSLCLPVVVSILVIARNRTPVMALKETYLLIRHRKISLDSILCVAIMYSLPFFVSSILQFGSKSPYFALVSSLWFLFCHASSVILYDRATKLEADRAGKNKTVLIV